MTPSAQIRDKATPDHKAAGRELAFALAWTAEHGRADGFGGLAAAFRKYLTPGEAAMVAWAALRAVAHEDLHAVLEAALPEPPAGCPDSPFLVEPMALQADAALWAQAAWPSERRAYAMACLVHMTEEERHAMVRALEGRVAA